MNRWPERSASGASSAELRAALEGALNEHFGDSRRISRLERRLSDYRTSFALEELDIELEDGASLRLVYKNVSQEALLDDARRVKPTFLHDPRREIATYREILGPNQLGTPAFYGAVVDEHLGRYWLFLERISGLELYQVGELATWQQVARWLALMHNRFAADADLPARARAAHLLSYNQDFYRMWIRRAQMFLQAREPPPSAGGEEGVGRAFPRMARLAEDYDRVAGRLAVLPVTFIHGEFYASNVLVAETVTGLRVCPVDWEMAALGPGLMDLAALTAGAWSDQDRAALGLAYYEVLDPHLAGLQSPDAFWTALDYCRLHLAVQWLGWSQDWSPPRAHAHDWLGEALHLVEKLGL